MRTQRRCWLFVAMLALVVAPSSRASAGDWTDTWESIRASCRGVLTIEADFVQHRSLKILRQPIVSQGKLAYRRPGDLRWEYASPVETVLVMHNGVAQRFLRSGSKLVPDATARLDAMGAVMAETNLWLSGDFTQSKLFHPELEHREGTTNVVLVPFDASMRTAILNIRVGLGQRPGTVRTIEIDEGTEGTTKIEFMNTSINGPVGGDRFVP